MEPTAKSNENAPKMPFKIDRALRDDIGTQVTDGVRMAILTGFYKPGDILPSLVEFARGLGVSTRAPQAALRALTREGFVSPRRHVGTVVLGPKPAVLHGRVVVAEANINPTYYGSSFEKRLSKSLLEAGYLVSRVFTPIVERPADDVVKERFDVRQFESALRQNTSLAVIVGARPHLAQIAANHGTPFATVSIQDHAAYPGCVGFASLDLGRILPAVVCRLRERGVRRLVQVALHSSELLDAAVLGGVCESVEDIVSWPNHALSTTQSAIVRVAYETFAARYRTKADLPDAFLFTDDYLARGALTALLAAGFETERDVLVATLANKGNAPVHPHPIDLILRDSAADAAAVADALLRYLETGVPAGTIDLKLEYVAADMPSPQQ